MNSKSATIRELRTDFRSVKRKIEQYGEIIITDHGEPAYLLRCVAPRVGVKAPLPDYFARLVKRQPQCLSAADTLRFWEEERQ